MKRWAPLLAAAAALIAVVVWLGSPSPTLPSIHSSAPAGLRVAARYLAERGRDVQELAGTEGYEGLAGTVVVALPSLRSWTEEEAGALARWVSGGGELVLLADGSTPLPPALEDALHLTAAEAPRVPGGSWETWKAAHLAARAREGSAGALQAQAARWLVTCPVDPGDADPAGADRYRDGTGATLVCRVPWGRGQVRVVNDVSLIQNANLAVADNLAFLEATFPTGAPIWFDEGHQRAASFAPTEYAGRLNLVLAQAVLVYLLVAWSQARPLGAPRPRRLNRAPSMVGELRTLGLLHAAGGHGITAGRRLLEMARRRYAGDERLAGLPTDVTRIDEAVAAGRRIAELERRPT